MPSALTDSLYGDLGLDLDALAAPLAEGDGAGVDIRYSPELDALADARRNEDDGEQGIWQTTTKKADWRQVVALSSEILAKRSKDLQVAVWLAQALVRLHGLRGLAVGLDLPRRLSEAMWPALWPQPDGDDLEPRLAPFYWIDAHLREDLLRLEVTEPPERERVGLTFQEILRSRKLRQIASNNPRAYEQAIEEGERSIEEIDALVEATSADFLMSRRDEADLALEAVAALRAELDLKAGRDAPSFKDFVGTLQDIQRFFSQALADRGLGMTEKAEAGSEDGAEDIDEDEDSMPARVNPPRFQMVAGMPAIPNRRAAYALLDYAADWLIENEPHSPAPYLVKRAVSWENRSLREVLSELMARGADADAIFEVLGIGEEGMPMPGRRRRVPALVDDD